MGSTDMYDPTLLEEIKNIKRVSPNTNIFSDILSTVVPESDSELEPGQFSESTDIPTPPDTNSCHSPANAALSDDSSIDPLIENSLQTPTAFQPVTDSITDTHLKHEIKSTLHDFPESIENTPQPGSTENETTTLVTEDHNFWPQRGILKSSRTTNNKKSRKVTFNV